MSKEKLCQSNDKLPQFLSFDFSKHQIYPEFQNNYPSLVDYYWALVNIIPHHFESYAIILHPIGYHQHEQYIEPKTNNRKSAFKAFGILTNDDIKLDHANDLYRMEGELMENNCKISRLSKYNLLYLSNGECSDVQYNFIINTLKKLVNNDIYYYYELLKIICHSEYDNRNISELLFKGEILTHQEVQQYSKIATQPSMLFDKSEKWVIATDHDIPYTFIGGNKSFVEKFLNAEYDIYPIEPKYQWIKKID